MWTFVKNVVTHGVWFVMLNDNISDDVNKIIDAYSLRFLDEFEDAFGRLPNDEELTCWRAGFADGCFAIGTALEMGLTQQGFNGIIEK